jgi:anti-sigma regulatory factor (Ser/Thr protein kinase)
MLNARQLFGEGSQIAVESARPEWTHLHFTPTSQSRQQIAGFVRSELADLPGDLCEQLALAVDELLGNSIEHGCRGDEKCEIAFTFVRTQKMILCQIRDSGPGFSLNSIAHAAISNPPEEPLRHTHYRDAMGLRPGGFGIMLVKKIADELIYSEAGNEVMLVKYL